MMDDDVIDNIITIAEKSLCDDDGEDGSPHHDK